MLALTRTVVKKAVLVGINYVDGTIGNQPLKGCVNDVKNIKKYARDSH